LKYDAPSHYYDLSSVWDFARFDLHKRGFPHSSSWDAPLLDCMLPPDVTRGEPVRSFFFLVCMVDSRFDAGALWKKRWSFDPLHLFPPYKKVHNRVPPDLTYEGDYLLAGSLVPTERPISIRLGMENLFLPLISKADPFTRRYCYFSSEECCDPWIDAAAIP